MTGSPLISIGDEIWIADGPKITFMGMPLPTRMTVVRLSGGRLWVHSPVAPVSAFEQPLEELGQVGAIVAPNKYHHLFLPEWIARYPQAAVYGGPGLKEKRTDITFHADLTEDAPEEWADAIGQTVFPDNRLFDEVVFFHHASSTLILTDLIINVRTDEYNVFQKLFASLDRMAWPKGGTPNSYKLAQKSKVRAREAVRKMIDWNPKAVIIAHGEWFPENGTAVLRERLKWVGI